MAIADDEIAAKKLSALAHPVRLAAIRRLVVAGPAGLPAGRLSESLGINPNALTFHLQKLALTGLVQSRRQGQFVIYCAVFDDLLDLANHLVGACCADAAETCGPRCPSSGGDVVRPSHPHCSEKGSQND
ncbi:ArsR/SmtB family transcription factor [Halomonas sp.]|jgi:DNA-binding transcriptional ArsR family regulator|uniref:ArsR/SmtB family transcription factor n=1 Tax=Halomonas sp. TaxID=1486246 RepID=UPI00356B5358